MVLLGQFKVSLNFHQRGLKSPQFSCIQKKKIIRSEHAIQASDIKNQDEEWKHGKKQKHSGGDGTKMAYAMGTLYILHHTFQAHKLEYIKLIFTSNIACHPKNKSKYQVTQCVDVPASGRT